MNKCLDENKKEPILIQSMHQLIMVQPNSSVSFQNFFFKNHSSKLKLQKIINLQLIRNMCALLQFNERKSSKWKSFVSSFHRSKRSM